MKPHRARHLVVVLAIAGLCLVAAGPAAGARPQSWAYSVDANTGVFFDFAAIAPLGWPPTGGLSTGFDNPTTPVGFRGSVTCMSVHGYTAVIGATGGGFLGPSFLIIAVDNSSPQKDPSGEILPGSPPDEIGAMPGGSSDCSIPPNFMRPLARGDIVVRDAQDQPPRLTVPRSVTITTGSRRPIRVTYRASAKDDFDRHPTLSCTPRSGSRFPIGTTRVRCTTRDRSGLTKTATFFVHVKFRAR